VAAQDTGDDEEAAVLPLIGDKSLWTARVNARSHVRPGQNVELVVDTQNLHFFDTDSGLAIGHPANVGR
ncbi:MAG: sugar transporter, ATP-binding protein, partial [Sphaerisporangium sp.]|nr:sugar transporter, ATP-binding protein [Sphaerisporangium sp.]